jgi:hypothetical protein
MNIHVSTVLHPMTRISRVSALCIILEEEKARGRQLGDVEGTDFTWLLITVTADCRKRVVFGIYFYIHCDHYYFSFCSRYKNWYNKCTVQ